MESLGRVSEGSALRVGPIVMGADTFEEDSSKVPQLMPYDYVPVFIGLNFNGFVITVLCKVDSHYQILLCYSSISSERNFHLDKLFVLLAFPFSSALLYSHLFERSSYSNRTLPLHSKVAVKATNDVHVPHCQTVFDFVKPMHSKVLFG